MTTATSVSDTEEDVDENSLQIDDMSLNEKNTDLDSSDSWESQSHSAATKRWLDWCRSQTSVVVCNEYDVPHGILPRGYNGILVDVKVGGKKRCPDDKLYLKHAQLREKVARGNCVLELHRIDKGKIVETRYIFLIFALKKFSGGLGDEDKSYDQSQWMHYFTKDIEATKKVISTEKENGEAAHIACWKLSGERYFCIGSKNVHMLVRNSEDISVYKESRFDFARRICRTFFHTYVDNLEIPEEKKQLFISFMDRNQYTLVAELIQPSNQHVVNLSHLKHPELRFICWTKHDLAQGGHNLCSMPINEAIDKAREFGLKTVEYEIVEISNDPVSEIEQYIPKVRKEIGNEGKVLYFLDSENNTIGVIKKKTAWYILLRALREKVAGFESLKSPPSVSETIKKIRKRIMAIQKWLDFSTEIAEGWVDISTGFAKWLHTKKAVQIRSNFPVIFNEYLIKHPDVHEKYLNLLEEFKPKPTLT